MLNYLKIKPGIDFEFTTAKNFTGMEYSAKHLHDYLNQDSNNELAILVDNDADGFTSSSLLYLYISKTYQNKIEFIFTEGKNHGVKSVKNKLINHPTSFFVIPDSSSDNVKELKELSKNGKDYIVLDHHELSDEKEIINNFLPIINSNRSDNNNPNMNLTGVGVTYVFVKYLDEINNTNYADDLLYLFSIGQIGDVSDVSEPEIRYLMIKGLHQFKNQSIFFTRNINVNHISPHELSFSIIPKINSVCRNGSITDKKELMKALINKPDERNVTIKVRKKQSDGKFKYVPTKVDYLVYESKRLETLKSKQGREVKKFVDNIAPVVVKNSVIAISEDHKNKNITGLIANKLSQQYQLPSLVLIKENGHLQGSARGNKKAMQDFKEFCSKTNLFDRVAGHSNAFGVDISEDNLNIFMDIDIAYNNSIYEIDEVYLNTTPTNKEIEQFDDNRIVFGGNVSDPYIGIVGLEVNKSLISIKGRMINITANAMKFVMYSAPDDLISDIKSTKATYIYFDVYGTPSVNNFMNKTFPQIVIDDLKITEPIEDEKNVVNFENFIF